jgi:hypothetical protein
LVSSYALVAGCASGSPDAYPATEVTHDEQMTAMVVPTRSEPINRAKSNLNNPGKVLPPGCAQAKETGRKRIQVREEGFLQLVNFLHVFFVTSKGVGVYLYPERVQSFAHGDLT